MSYIRKTKVLVLIGFCLFLSCEKEIVIDTPEQQKKLVAHSTFRPFTTPYVKDFQLHLTSSSSILDNRNIDTIEDAKVILFENGSILDTLDYYDSLGLYKSDEFPTTGNEYRVEIMNEGYPEVSASDAVPEKSEVSSIEVDTVAFIDVDDNYYSRISLRFSDAANIENYYEIQVKEAGSKEFRMLSTNDISIVNERYYPSQLDPGFSYPKRLLFSDNHFEGEQKELSFFFEPAAYTEFENGKPVRFFYDQVIEVYFRSISKCYFDYYTSLLEKLDNQEGEILYGMVEPFEIPSNVEGGFGIFAGYQVDMIQFRIEEQRIN